LIQGLGTNVVIEFVDWAGSGEYHLAMDESEKEALLYGPGVVPPPVGVQEFNSIQTYVMAQRAPVLKFKDLNSVADSTIRYSTLPMQVQVDYLKVTDATDLCNISVVFDHKDLRFAIKDGKAKATVNLFGRIRLESPWTVNWFEDTLEVSVSAEMLQHGQDAPLRFITSIPIPAGAYRLNIVAKDVVAGTLNNTERQIEAPRYAEDQLSSSSVILADVMERQPTKGIDPGTFVIGASEVRPRMTGAFKRTEQIGIYAEFYNFGTDEENPRKPDATIEYEVVSTGTHQVVFAMTEEAGKMENASPSLVVVEKFLPLSQLEPGSYSIKMKVVDRKGNQTLTTPPAGFTVTT
jgi:hypothetical protein